MSRETAYRLRRRDAGRAFALAWDAALVLARQRLVDEVYELAYTGSIEQIFRDGQLFAERRRRDPASLLATIERLGSNDLLNATPVRAAAQDFDMFLDCLEADSEAQTGQNTAKFMDNHAEYADYAEREELQDCSRALTKSQKAPSKRSQKALE